MTKAEQIEAAAMAHWPRIPKHIDYQACLLASIGKPIRHDPEHGFMVLPMGDGSWLARYLNEDGYLILAAYTW